MHQAVAIPTIHALDRVDLALSPVPLAVPDAFAARAERHWAEATAANPRLFNGRVFGTLAPGRPGGLDLDGRVLTGSVVELDYATFLTWRDEGFPDVGILNLFGSAVILSSDGALLYGVMGRHTSNAGRFYPPGGSLEPRDLKADGRIDVIQSIELELAEETGLDPAAATVEGMHAVFDGPRVSIARILRFPQTADVLARRVRSFIDSERDPELDDVAIVWRAADLPVDRTPPYARAIADLLVAEGMVRRPQLPPQARLRA